MEFIKIKENNSLVRIFFSVDNIKDVDVYINDKIVFEKIKCIEFSSYKQNESANVKVDVYSSGQNKTPIISQMVNLMPKNIYTIAIVGDKKKLNLLVINDKVSKNIEFLNSSMRVVNLYKKNEIEIYIDDEKMLEMLSFKQGCDYMDIRPDKYNIKVYNNKQKILLDIDIGFKESKLYTLYLVEKDKKLNIVKSIDGNSYVQECITFY